MLTGTPQPTIFNIMDSFSLIMGIIFALAMFGPIAYLLWAGQSRTKRMKNILKNLSQDHAFQFAMQEVWGDKALALDSIHKVFVFQSRQTGAEVNKVIALGNATYCKLDKKKDKVQVLIGIQDTLGLYTETISIFDTQYDDPSEAGFHALLGEKWKESIRSVIMSETTRPSKAA